MADPEAAVAIVRAFHPEESVLLIRRSEREEDSWSGHWSFPGGRCDPGDAGPLHTALRELQEECGVSLAPECCEGPLPAMLARRKIGRFLLVAPFLFRIDTVLPTILDPREASQAAWIPLHKLRDSAQHTLQSVPYRPNDTLFPAVQLDGTPLWGFTYRLIVDWLGLTPLQIPREAAGFQVACRLLDFLLTQGLTRRHGWEDCEPTAEMLTPDVIKVAVVEGTIPVELVQAHLSLPDSHVPYVNYVQVRPESIRVVGLDFEEYVISAERTR